MALLDFIFDWWRHRREERQDSRDQTRLEREKRDELRSLYDDLIESAPAGRLRDAAQERRFRAVLQIISDVEPKVLDEPLQIHSGVELPALPAAAPIGPSATPLLAAVGALCELERFAEALALVRFADGLGTTREPKLILAAITALEGLGRTDEALQEVELLVDAGVPRWQTLRSQVLIYVGSGRFEEAMRAADSVIHEENEEAYGLALRAFVESHQGRHKKALATATAACDARPGDKNLLGLKLDMAITVDLEQANEVADAVLAAEPTNASARRTKAEWFLKRNEIKAARAAASKVVALEPDNPATHMLMARVLEADGDYDASLEELARVAAMRPLDPEALWRKLGPIFRKALSDSSNGLEQDLNAISVLSAVIEHHGTDQAIRATAHVMRAVFLLVYGARDIANADIRQAQEIEIPESTEKNIVELLKGLSAKLSSTD